jgi:hypothetical protein
MMLVCMPITGAGVALTFPATRIAALDAVPARYAALASGVTSSSRYFGGIIGALVAGLALVGTVEVSAARLFIILAVSGALAALVGSRLTVQVSRVVGAGVSTAS